jgi:hypothetical protein
MVELDKRERLDTVGDQGVVAPVWEQLGLSANQAGAADDEPPGAERALGDLGDALWRVVVQLLPARLRDRSIARRTLSCWVTPIEWRAPCCSSAVIVLLLQKPEDRPSAYG